MIKAIIFDFFGVLALRSSASFRQTYYPDDPEKTKRTRKLQDELGRGLISYDDYIDGLAKLGGVDRDIVVKYTSQYQSNIELLEYIENRLKPDYRLGIISNTGADWVLGILGPSNVALFDDIVLSYQVGMIKPEPEIYILSAKNMGVKAEECVFIDDISAYCEGAEAAGMQAIWYQNFDQMRKQLDKLLTASPNN